MEQTYKELLAGLLTGISNTIIFNPYDKALYMQVKNNTTFFNKNNWIQPYTGISQSLIHRTISYGLYFPIYDFYKRNTTFTNYKIILDSVLTGCTTSILINPINIIKYNKWNNISTKYNLFILTKGIKYTILRDSIFTLNYNYLNQKYNKNKNILLDIILGCISTLCVSPINYCRNIVFSSQQKIYLKNIINNIRYEKISDIIFNKFNIGYGTIRIGLGISISKFMYENLLNNIK